MRSAVVGADDVAVEHFSRLDTAFNNVGKLDRKECAPPFFTGSDTDFARKIPVVSDGSILIDSSMLSASIDTQLFIGADGEKNFPIFN